jgi:hypothetical protein
MVQRDGCWVRRTTGWLGQVREEVGPCARAGTQWAEDRVTRVVQECAARADHQWQTRALIAWNRGEPLPPQEPEESVLRDCMAQSVSVIAEENEREALEARLAEAARERDALRAGAEQDHAQLRASISRMTDHLGEAAKKESPPAIATASATSEGHQRTDGRSGVASTSTASPPPAVPARGSGTCDGAAPSRQARGVKGTAARGTCPTPAAPADAAAPATGGAAPAIAPTAGAMPQPDGGR